MRYFNIFRLFYQSTAEQKIFINSDLNMQDINLKFLLTPRGLINV